MTTGRTEDDYRIFQALRFDIGEWMYEPVESDPDESDLEEDELEDESDEPVAR